MGIKSIIGAICACLAVVSFSANAALVSRLGGLAYYDTEADLTWLADANVNGLMNQTDAFYWAVDLSVGGVGGWRLPDTLWPDASCDFQGFEESSGFNCTGSEMGNLFYNVLGGSAGSSITTTHNANYDLFSNVQPYFYWTRTDFLPSGPRLAYVFNMGNGEQSVALKLASVYAWAVRSGDVSAVPVPAAMWLFGSGLIGLIAVARRNA